MNIQLTVVAPMYNEAIGISSFITTLHTTLEALNIAYHVILVNDGSDDATLDVALRNMNDKPAFKMLNLSRNFGHEIAMTAGLQHVNPACDYTVIMDSDLQDPPELIPQLYQKIKAEHLDVVYAQRMSRAGETWAKKLTSKAFYAVAKKLTGLDIPTDAGDFRIMSKRVVAALSTLTESDRNMKMLYAYVGFSKGALPFERPKRHAGETSYNWLKLVNAALDSIVSFSTLPLRLVSLLGLLASIGLFGTSVWVIIRKLFGAYAVAGWSSMMVVITLLFALLFLFLAILSEYIGRILTESKKRPLYYVQDEYNAGKTSKIK